MADASAATAGGCAIKGNISLKGNRIYHVPGNLDYVLMLIDPAADERMFISEDDARSAGWRAA